MFFFDPLYLLLMLPGLAIAAWAQFKVKGTYAKYQNVRTRSGMTGADVAQMLLRARGLGDVTIEPTRGFLSDHYDPRNRVLRLSEANYRSNSISAVGVPRTRRDMRSSMPIGTRRSSSARPSCRPCSSAARWRGSC
jgi:Zn-dependent membrane protease YugP